jgi:hypothetical protein
MFIELRPRRKRAWQGLNSINSDSGHRVHFFMPWELPEFTWKSTWNCSWALTGGGCYTPHTPRSLRPWRSCIKKEFHWHIWQCWQISASYPGANNVLKIATLQCFYIDQWLSWASARVLPKCRSHFQNNRHMVGIIPNAVVSVTWKILDRTGVTDSQDRFI